MSGIIDCDVHPYTNDIDAVLPYMPEAWQKLFEGVAVRFSGRGPLDRFMPHASGSLRMDTVPPQGGMPASDPEFAAVQHLDKYEVRKAVLLPMQPTSVGVWTDPVASSVFVSAMNRYFLEHWVGVDDRYRLCINVSPHDPEEAANEIRRYGETPGVVGVFLTMADVLMGDRYYHPIYEAAQEHNLPIIVHPSGAEGWYHGVQHLAGKLPRTYAAWHTLFPQVAQSNLASLVFDGAFERFPELRVVLVEFGFSWTIPLFWRMDKEWQNFRYDIPWLKRAPSEYALEHVWWATQPIDEPQDNSQLWELVRMIGLEDRLVFSSDYPHYDTDNPETVRARIPADVRDRISHTNAETAFGERL